MLMTRIVHEGLPTPDFGVAKAQEARAFHRAVAGYEPTPLVGLGALATACGVAGIYVKDESRRFGLNAFKGLGGIFAMHRMLEGAQGRQTFVTATDGNHGRGVAWAAGQLGHDARVLMPAGSSPERLENIRALGAQAEVTDLNYDDCVRLAAQLARDNGWLLIQDTSWDGYEEVPALIMQGYTTMGIEIAEQLEVLGGARPTHVFLQAGVGAMSGAMAGFFADLYGDARPTVAVVEPEGAACIYRTAKASDGELHAVRELNTIMAGLSCGEPCGIGWESLRENADFAIACPDSVAADGMRVLGNPLPGDARIVSGESGAVTVGLLVNLLLWDSDPDTKDALGLGPDSIILCISTEGDTDRASYRNIVWRGAHSW